MSMEGPPPPPMELPPYAPPAPEPAAPRGPRPSNTQILVMLTVASLLLVAGLAMIQARGLITSPQRSDYPSSEAYLAAVRAYSNTMRALAFVGMLFLDLVAGLVLLGGFLIALGRTDLPDSLRRATVVMGVVLAALWIIVYFLMGNFILAFP